jgi:hypothetical protein
MSVPAAVREVAMAQRFAPYPRKVGSGFYLLLESENRHVTQPNRSAHLPI